MTQRTTNHMHDDPEDHSYALDGSGYSTPVDELYDAAKELVMKHNMTTVSHLQRELRVGYHRASRIMKELERAGIVSKRDNVGNHEVLVKDD